MQGVLHRVFPRHDRFGKIFDLTLEGAEILGNKKTRQGQAVLDQTSFF